jgi:hypothetical protein
MTVSIHILDLVYMFLAHLSQRLNLAIVIVICLSFYVINIKEQFFFFYFYFLFVKGERGVGLNFNTSSQSHDGRYYLQKKNKNKKFLILTGVFCTVGGTLVIKVYRPSESVYICWNKLPTSAKLDTNHACLKKTMSKKKCFKK